MAEGLPGTLASCASFSRPPESLGDDGARFSRDNAYTPIDVAPETVSAIYEVAGKIGPRSTKDELGKTIASGGVTRFIDSLEQAMPGARFSCGA